jgi:hypothetical protein
MGDLQKTIDYVERGMLRGLDRRASTLPKGMVAPPRPTIRGWRAPVSVNDDASKVAYPVEQIFRPKNKPQDTSRNPPMTARLNLNARAIKITVPLDTAQIAALSDPGGQASRCQLAITCEGKVYIADVATKAVRKAKSTISANGVENVFAMIQGKLKGN